MTFPTWVRWAQRGELTRGLGNARSGAVSAPVAEKIARYIAQAGAQKPAVIGHSMGGTIGPMLAERRPQAISKLMVADMVPFMGRCSASPARLLRTFARSPTR